MRALLTDIRDSGRRKWLMFTPLLVITLIFAYMSINEYTTRRLLLEEKYVQIVDSIDIMSASMAATRSRAATVDPGKTFIAAAVERMDELPYVYAALYQYVDGELVCVSKRTADIVDHLSFNAMDFEEFRDAISREEVESGDVMLPVDKSSRGSSEMHLYYSWMPMAYPPELRYLVVGGVTEYSVVTPIPALMNAAPYLMMTFVLLVTIWQFGIIIRQSTRVDKLKSMLLRLGSKGV